MAGPESEKEENAKEENVVAFDSSLVRKLQNDLMHIRQERSEIIEGSRLYWQRVQVVHEAVIMLHDAAALPDAVSILQEDVARLLGFDAITLIYERLADDKIGALSSYFRAIPAFMVNAAFAATEFHIVEDRAQLESLFPEQSAQMAFAICLPLQTGDRHGALVMANRNAQYLSLGQALEPYVFLARCVERLGRQWLSQT
ncbi:MAG: hypothetical protein EB059_05065 [Alphaproteobacteria bacterium]|nr:hypothetical protein [Alphaproteobacteria bacterium]